jgi:hypothetical protein
MKASVIAAAALAMAGAAQASEPGKVSLTVYNSNLALVQDIRSLDVPAGRSRLELEGVSDQIRPETVGLSAPGIEIVEQNFDYDLLTPSKLMEKAVGKQVKVVRTNPGTGAQVTETATVLSANQGVVLKIGDRIEVLRDDGIPTRVIFDSIPDNLRARPTLSVTVNSTTAGRRDAVLSYLSTGLSWKADYVVLFDEAKNALDLQGWVTLVNSADTSFRDADVQVVAGQVSLSNSPQEYWNQNQQRGRAGTESSDGASVADYHLYPLPERVTVAANQTKQVGFVEARGVTAKKGYRYEANGFASSETPAGVEVALNFSNSRAAGAPAALPAGVMRVYMRDKAGDPKFIGESAIGHTPQGSDLSVKTGDAFDVTVQPTLVSTDKVSGGRLRYAMSYRFANARAEPVSVEFRQSGFGVRRKVISESLPSTSIDDDTLGWTVPIPANGETILTFTADSGS